MYEFYDKKGLTWYEYLDTKYDYQERLDRYMAEGMDFEDAHYRAQDELGIKRSPIVYKDT